MMSETVVTVESGRPTNAGAPPKPNAQQQSGGPLTLSWTTFNVEIYV